MRFAACVVTLWSLFACSERRATDASTTGGTIVIAASGEPDDLFPPFSSNVPAQQVTELVYDHLANIGPALNIIGDSGFSPALADSWKWSKDSLSIAFHINPKARWHDGVPVRARDVVFTRAEYVSPALGAPMGEELKSIDSVTAGDSLTAVFWFHSRSPQQFFTATTMMLILPEHIFGKMKGDSLRIRSSSAAPVGTGRFRFAKWVQGSSLEITADTANYRGRPPLDRVIWSVSPDYVGALTKLLGGEADLFDALHAESMPRVVGNKNLRTVVLPGMDYAFLQFNLKEPGARSVPHHLFGNRDLRRALTMLVDRAALVKSVFDTLGAVSIGPTLRTLPSTSPELKQIPFDTSRGAAILDSLGWRRRASDGIRERNGRELSFTMIVPAASSARNRMAVLIQSQLRRAGIRADIENMESQAFTDRQSARDFDAALGAWHVTADPSAIREVWTTAASRKNGGRNYGSYENAEFDADVESAVAAPDNASAMKRYSRAYQTIIDDAPAIWLYEPKTVLGIHRRIVTAGMVPGTWWAGLGTWSISPSARIARDRLGVGR